MVGHSIRGVAFPYLSPTASYWYIVAGEEKALEYVSITDVGGDAAAYAVTKVQLCGNSMYNCDLL